MPNARARVTFSHCGPTRSTSSRTSSNRSGRSGLQRSKRPPNIRLGSAAVAEHETSIDIDAPPDIVWEHLVTADGLSAWMGERVEVEPTAGGRFAMHIQGSEIRGQFVEVDAPRRLVITWGVLGSADHPPGSSAVEFRLAKPGRG